MPAPAPATSSPSRLRGAAAFFFLQALVWVVMTVAVAALIELAGWSQWQDALYFSATNWLPWIAIAPVVFWLTRRFPFERAFLLRSIPVHLLACSASIVLVVWISALVAPTRWPWAAGRPPFLPDGRASERVQRESRDRPAAGGEKRIVPAVPTDPAPTEEGAVVPTAPTAPTTDARRPERRSGSWPAGEFGPRRSMSSTAVPRSSTSYESDSWGRRLRRWATAGSFWPPFGSAIMRINFSAAVYVIIACVAHAAASSRRAKERETQALALAAGLTRAKLDALRLQLQPHFLFNTLNALSALVHRDPRAADELIADLSELLRLSLESSANEVPLRRELEILDRYLAIEQTRLGDRLRVTRDIDPAVLEVLVPTFILQPLAENAVRHGIEPRCEPGHVTITARAVGDLLELTVGDDGVGLRPAAQGARRGIGLTNAEERLRTLHGERARLELRSPETGGVAVVVTLPRRQGAGKDVAA